MTQGDFGWSAHPRLRVNNVAPERAWLSDAGIAVVAPLRHQKPGATFGLCAEIPKVGQRDGRVRQDLGKGRELLPRDRLRIQGESIGHTCGWFGVAFGFAGPYLAPIDFRPDDLDLLWKRSR